MERKRQKVLDTGERRESKIERHVRTRVYYTSESHVNALRNVLRYGVKAKFTSLAASQAASKAGINTTIHSSNK